MSIEKLPIFATNAKFNSLSVDENQLAILTTQSINLGLTSEEVSNILAKFGPGTLSIVVELIRNGLSASVVLQMLYLYGAPVLEFLVDLIFHGKQETEEKKNLLGGRIGDVVGGMQADFTRAIMQVVANKILPLVVDAYGKSILDAIVGAIQAAVDDPKMAGKIDEAMRNG